MGWRHFDWWGYGSFGTVMTTAAAYVDGVMPLLIGVATLFVMIPRGLMNWREWRSARAVAKIKATEKKGD